MRFTAGLPTERVQHGDEFISAAAITEMAQACEKAGFDAAYVTDHPFPPDAWMASGGHHALDPFVALSFAAAVTKKLRLHTNIMVLGYRNPFLAAKTVVTLDVLSGGRVILGVAAGYLEAEFRALGVSFEDRNARADEVIVAMKKAWTEDHVVFDGTGYSAEGNTMLPRPVQKPHPPIWVGGNSKRAARRAVELCDGWAPFPNPPSMAEHTKSPVLEGIDDLKERIAHTRELIAKNGRTTPLDISFSLTAFNKGQLEPQKALDTIGALSAIGVTWNTVRIPARTRAEYCDNAARFGELVIGNPLA